MRLQPILLAPVLSLIASVALAADYRVEAFHDAPPADALADEIANRLAPTGLKVSRGNRTFCEIWLAKAWPLKAAFTPSDTVLYPFEVGELIGVVRYKSKAEDFRGQQIASGVYTLRYGQQPVDGNHVGTSATRDFLLLLKAAEDTSPEPIAQENLFKFSADAAESTHPAILTLLQPGDAAGELPAIVHHEDRDLWTLLFLGKGIADGKPTDVRVNVVVVGRAAE